MKNKIYLKKIKNDREGLCYNLENIDCFFYTNQEKHDCPIGKNYCNSGKYIFIQIPKPTKKKA